MDQQRQRDFERLEREVEQRFDHIDLLLAKFYKIHNAHIEAKKGREAAVVP